MPVVSPEKLIALQRSRDDIRNICILAHVVSSKKHPSPPTHQTIPRKPSWETNQNKDGYLQSDSTQDHGKTSLSDALIATNGIISPKLAGKIRYLDSRPDEQLRGITMESSAISLYFSMLRRSGPDVASEQKEYLVNLIDSPGHIDFSSEVSTASRLCDGAIVLVDAVEGVCSQTVTVLRQTWIEHLKPLLVINKIDRLITELKMSPGEAYTHLCKLLEQVNAVVGSFFQGERMEEDMKWRERIEERLAAATAAKGKDKAEGETMVTTNGAADDPDSTTASTTGEYEEKDDEDIYFAPEKNNVIFSSAIDGWAFTVKQFAALYEKKLGIKRAVLEKTLWGEFYLDPKTKRVLGQKHLKGRTLKPMFAQLVLENIWAVYDATTGGGKGKGFVEFPFLLCPHSKTNFRYSRTRTKAHKGIIAQNYSDPELLQKITKSLNITLPPHVLRSKDPRVILTALFAAWLPLSTAVLVSVIESLPSPPTAQASRLPAMIESSPGADHVDPHVRDAMIGFKVGKEEPVVAYVSKMVAIPESELPENRRRAGGLSAEEARELAQRKRAEIARAQALAEAAVATGATAITETLSNTHISNGSGNRKDGADLDPERLIGFARLYSGTLAVGDSIYVLPPKFSPAAPHAHPEPQKTTITALYLLMGRSLEPLSSVPAGVVFGIAGLDGHILKSGTLCSQVVGGVNLAGVTMGTQPIVRVALEPVIPSDLGKMIAGLRMLEQADPCAEYEVLESGEHVIVTAGELHLERCLKDLRERFARCEIQASEPIVPYRESIVSAAEMAPPREKDLPRGTVIGVTTSKQATLRLRVRPLPSKVTEFLGGNATTIKNLYSERGEKRNGTASPRNSAVGAGVVLPSVEFKLKLQETFDVGAKGDRDTWASVVGKIVAFGPRRSGPNILVDSTKDRLLLRDINPSEHTNGSTDPTSSSLSPHDFSDKISYAFQLATSQGPLCDEPMQGVAVFLEDVALDVATAEEDAARSSERLGRLTGEVIKTVRGSIRQGFLDWSPRLLLAMYSCEIQASADVLGRVYGVITRRRGRILSESLNEGTPFYSVLSLLPVAESFGFSEEIRKRSSGAASPQLIFQGFEMLDQDPFWVPFTEEDLEDLGELADRENVAKRYMDRVRERKGLFVSGKKLVQNAEKQKTLKR
ncbi:MAG: Cytoplasmic GTPase/eEF2-like protein (ribosomal biogenesis) [Trichoglossum hirsutum]|nr:MAG: Cytoplasmic GTPase/eEF2-like protein (ribosomal biogenesis) [Trichoglossum hirsutum]